MVIFKNAIVLILMYLGLSFAQQAPYINNVKALSDHSVQISWRNNSTQTKGFIVERGLSRSAFEFVGSTNKDATLFIDSTLKPETKYYYSMKAVFEADTSDYSNIDSAVTYKRDAYYRPVGSLSLSWDKTTQSITISFFDSSNCEKGWNISESVNDGPFSLTGSFKSDEPEKTGSFSYVRKECAENTWYTYMVTTFSEQDSTTSKSFSIYTLNGRKFLDQMKKIHLVGKVSDFPINKHRNFFVMKNNGFFTVREPGIGDSMLSVIDYSSVQSPKFAGYKYYGKYNGIFLTLFDSSIFIKGSKDCSTKLLRMKFENNSFVFDSCSGLPACNQASMEYNNRDFRVYRLNDDCMLLFTGIMPFSSSVFFTYTIYAIKNTRDSITVSDSVGNYYYSNGPSSVMTYFPRNFLVLNGYVFNYASVIKTDSSGHFVKNCSLGEKSYGDFQLIETARVIKDFILDDSLISKTNFIDTTQKVIFFINDKSIEAYRYDYGPKVLKIRDNNFNQRTKARSVYSLKYKNQWLYIDRGLQLIEKIEMFAADGRCIYTLKNVNSKASGSNCFYVGELNNGCYFVKMYLHNNDSGIYKVVITR